MRVKLCRYLSSYDPIRKQETQKLFFINKYQSCRGLNTSLLLRSFPSLCKTTMGSYTWDFLIARSPKAPSKIYSPLSPREDLILSQATKGYQCILHAVVMWVVRTSIKFAPRQGGLILLIVPSG